MIKYDQAVDPKIIIGHFDLCDLYSCFSDFALYLQDHLIYHHENKSVLRTPPYIPLLNSKTGVYRGIHYFLIFALKHRLWVLDKTASVRRF